MLHKAPGEPMQFSSGPLLFQGAPFDGKFLGFLVKMGLKSAEGFPRRCPMLRVQAKLLAEALDSPPQRAGHPFGAPYPECLGQLPFQK
jgi:hypothetical protein